MPNPVTITKDATFWFVIEDVLFTALQAGVIHDDYLIMVRQIHKEMGEALDNQPIFFPPTQQHQNGRNPSKSES